MAASYISKDELIHLLKGGVLADYTNGEYSHFYKLDDEAFEYETGRKLLEKPIKKYVVKILKGKSAERCSSYLNVNYRANIVTFASDIDFGEWRASFTKNEIEELKKRDDIAIDWNKVELEEVDGDE